VQVVAIAAVAVQVIVNHLPSLTSYVK
jgi:hypothetical protein